MVDLSKFERVPISELLEPVPGRIVYPRSWWVVSEEGEVFFFGPNHTSPQTNTSEAIATRLWANFAPGCKVMRLPMLFLKHRCE